MVVIFHQSSLAPIGFRQWGGIRPTLCCLRVNQEMILHVKSMRSTCLASLGEPFFIPRVTKPIGIQGGASSCIKSGPIEVMCQYLLYES